MRVTIAPERGEQVVLPADPARPWAGWCLGAEATGCLSGWYSSPAPRAELVARPQADGGFFPATLLTAARIVTVVFFHQAGDGAGQEAACQLVGSWTKQRIRLVVEDGEGVRHATGYVSALPSVEVDSVSRITRFSVVITCPDPLTYGGPGGLDDGLVAWNVAHGRFGDQAAGGLLFPLFDQGQRDDVVSTMLPTARFSERGLSNSLAIRNKGTAASWPVLEADGPVEWVQWSANDLVVRWNSWVPAGQVVRVDTRIGAVSVAGERVSVAPLVRDGFFQLAPGVTHVTFAASDTTSWRVRWLDAWM